jgi:hypothetical protein
LRHVTRVVQYRYNQDGANYSTAIHPDEAGQVNPFYPTQHDRIVWKK